MLFSYADFIIVDFPYSGHPAATNNIPRSFFGSPRLFPLLSFVSLSSALLALFLLGDGFVLLALEI